MTTRRFVLELKEQVEQDQASAFVKVMVTGSVTVTA
jgi:hypothetical protein